MKKITVFMFMAFFLVGVFVTTPQEFVHAQEAVCRDASSGTVIPCPPTAEIPCGQAGGPACPPPPGGDDNDGGNQNPPPSAVTPSPTSLPIANPTEGSITADWSNLCLNGDSKKACLKDYAAKCIDGDGDISTNDHPDGTGTVLVCTKKALLIELTPLPITNPKEEDGAGGWTGKCSKYNTTSISKCVDGHLADCKFDGGTASQSTSDDGTVSVACKNTSNSAMINPTPLPIANAEADDNWVGHCSKTDDNLAECIQKYKCEDGLLVIKVDIYAGTYDFYCIPHVVDPQVVLPFAIPPDDGATGNWTGGCFGDDTDGCLNDMKAACDEEGGEYSEWYDDEGGVGAHCANSSESAPAPGGGFGGWLPWLGGGVVGILIGILLVTLDRARSKALK